MLKVSSRAPRPEPTAARCANCGTASTGAYCPACGQSARVGRLSLRGLGSDLVHRFLSFDRGLGRTVRDLFVRPGAMMRDYVAGRRASYTNPLTYLIFGTALNLIVYNLSGMREKTLAQMREGLLTDPNLQSAELFQMMSQLLEMLVDNNLYLMLVMAVPFAILLRLFFWGSGYTFAEVAVLPLYVFGHVAVVGTFVSLALGNLAFDLQLISVLSLLVYLLFGCYAAAGFFGRRLSVVLRTAAALVISYGATMLLAGIFFLVALATGLAGDGQLGGGETWTLLDAVEANAPPVARRLLEEGADPNMVDTTTPLHVAAERGDLAMVDLLLDHGADPDRQDQLLRTPLILALHAEHSAVARRLVEVGTDPNLARSDGTTPLMETVEHKEPELLRMLLERGADPDAVRPNHDEATALMEAVVHGDVEMLDELLRAGADPSIPNHRGRTAAELTQDSEILSRLEAAASGADRMRQGV